jgi:hypothetical protein
MEGYLAYDRGKIAVVGIHGVFVLVLDSILDQLGEVDLPPKDVSLQQPTSSEHKPSWPNLRLREVEFDDLDMINTDIISCLQLTETKLYVSVLSDDFIGDRVEICGVMILHRRHRSREFQTAIGLECRGRFECGSRLG